MLLFEHCVMMSGYVNCCVRQLLILARIWFTFGLPSKMGCDMMTLRLYNQQSYIAHVRV
jgi:hypothetical protein